MMPISSPGVWVFVCVGVYACMRALEGERAKMRAGVCVCVVCAYTHTAHVHACVSVRTQNAYLHECVCTHTNTDTHTQTQTHVYTHNHIQTCMWHEQVVCVWGGGGFVSTCALNEIEEPLHAAKKKEGKRDSYRQIPSDTLFNISSASAPIAFFPIFFSLAQEPLQPKQKIKKYRTYVHECMSV